MGYLKHHRGIHGKHLVIAPKSTLANWYNEFRRWCPSINVVKFHGDKEGRALQRQKYLDTGDFEVIVTTYEMAIIEKAALKKFSWRYLIIDEAHRIKNEKSILSVVIRLYHSNYRLLLTGTPLQNNLHELWALLNFLLPDVFSSSEDFDAWFGDINGEDKSEVTAKLHKVLRPFLLRRLKTEVEHSLPPKKEIKLYIGMTDMQREWYTSILSKNVDVINTGQKKDKGSKMRLLNVLMQLRKCCNHPYLFHGAEPGPPYTTGEHLILNSGKLTLLDKLLKKLEERGSRVLIFSQMTRLLDILEDYMNYRQYKYCRLDGQTAADDREESIEAFNKPDSDKFAFLLSTRAGGLGINLATADIVILFDSDWNPQVDLQAQDRAHRIGQKKPVMVYRLITEKTIEEKVVERAEAKLYLDAVVIQQGRLVEQNQRMSKDELMNMIRFGAEEVFNAKGSTVSDADIDLILADGEARTKQMNEKLQKRANTLGSFDMESNQGSMSLYQFMGKDYSKDVSIPNKGPSFLELPQRERKKNTYHEDQYYRNIFRTRKTGPKRKAVRAPKQPKIYDFQFFPQELKELYEKETAAFLWRRDNGLLDDQKAEAKAARQAAKEARKAARKKAKLEEQGLPVPADIEAAAEGAMDAQRAENEAMARAAEKARIAMEKAAAGEAVEVGGLDAEKLKECPPELTEEEEKRKEELSTQGFSNWSKKDFSIFLKCCEVYGRNAHALIAAETETKTTEEVAQYSKVFWERYTEVDGWEKMLTHIERGESKLQKRDSMINALSAKMKKYKDPWKQLKVVYNTNKGKQFTPEEDRFLVCMTHKVGYGNWDALKYEVRTAWQFRFDWFIKSRTPLELGRRVDTLIRLIEKELNLNKKTGRKKPGPKPKANGSPAGRQRGGAGTKRKSATTRAPKRTKNAE